MAYPTAEQVANAYTLNLNPSIQQIAGIGETITQTRLLAEKRRKEQLAAQMQGIGLISDTIDPLEKGTGYSPYDDLNAAHLGVIKQRATQMIMAGADPLSTKMYLDNASNGIKARQQDALKGITAAESIAKQKATADPALDYTGMRQQYLDNIFYSKDDKGNKVFNLNFNPSVDFTAGVQPVYDPVKLKELSVTELPKLFPEQRSMDVPGEPGFSYSAKVPAYLVPDGKSKQTAWNVTPLTIKNPDGQEQQFAAIKTEIADKLFAAPHTGRYLQSQFEQHRALFPKTVSDTDIRRIVATDFLQQHGQQPGGGLEEDDSEYTRQRQAQKDALEQKHWNASFGLQKQAAARADERLSIAKGKGSVQGYVSPYDIATGWATGSIKPTDDTPAANMLKIHTHVINGRPIVDVNGIAEKDMLTDPDSGSPIRVLGFRDPITRGMAYSVLTYRKATPKEVEKGSEPYIQTGTKNITGKEFNRYHTALAPQLQLDTKKKNYNATLTSAAALSE